MLTREVNLISVSILFVSVDWAYVQHKSDTNLLSCLFFTRIFKYVQVSNRLWNNSQSSSLITSTSKYTYIPIHYVNFLWYQFTMIPAILAERARNLCNKCASFVNAWSARIWMLGIFGRKLKFRCRWCILTRCTQNSLEITLENNSSSSAAASYPN